MRLVWYEAAARSALRVHCWFDGPAACRDAAYFTPRGQSYPQAGPDFRDIGEGLLSANIINQLSGCGAKQSSPYRGEPIGTGPRIYPVSN